MQKTALALSALSAAVGTVLLGLPLTQPGELAELPAPAPTWTRQRPSHKPELLDSAPSAPVPWAQGEPITPPPAQPALPLATVAAAVRAEAAAKASAEAGRVESLGLAALGTDWVTREEAFEELCALSLLRADLAGELRRALFLVAEAGGWPAEALCFLPMAGASPQEIGRLATFLDTAVDVEVRRAAIGALGRADPDTHALLELEAAFSRERDLVLVEEIAAASVRVAGTEATRVLERLLATPRGCATPMQRVLADWREALAAGELNALAVFAAGAEHED